MDISYVPIWLPFSFLVFFMLLWFTSLLLTAVLGGWIRLAEKFPQKNRTTSALLKYASATMNYGTKPKKFGRSKYGRILNMTVGADGLGIGVLWAFRPAHPPIFLPWGAIKCVNMHSNNVVEVIVPAPATTVVIYGKAARAVKDLLEENPVVSVTRV